MIVTIVGSLFLTECTNFVALCHVSVSLVNFKNKTNPYESTKQKTKRKTYAVKLAENNYSRCIFSTEHQQYTASKKWQIVEQFWSAKFLPIIDFYAQGTVPFRILIIYALVLCVFKWEEEKKKRFSRQLTQAPMLTYWYPPLF